MTTTVQRILRINDAVSAINPTQIAVEPTLDSDLGFRMWGGKDASGGVTKWLAKDKNARVLGLGVTSLSEGVVKADSAGNLGTAADLAALNTLLGSDIDEASDPRNANALNATPIYPDSPLEDQVLMVTDVGGTLYYKPRTFTLTSYVPYSGATANIDLGAYGVLVGAGSEALPSLAFSTDPNTGVYLADVDKLGISVAGGSLATFSSPLIEFKTGTKVSKNGVVLGPSDFATLENTSHDTSMIGTATAIKFKQFYHDGVPASVESGSFRISAETNWTSDPATQKAQFIWSPVYEGTLVDRMALRSNGTLVLGDYISSTTALLDVVKVGSAKVNTELLRVVNRYNAADMDGTASSIAFYGYTYDIVTPALQLAGRHTFGAEADWRASDLNTVNSFAAVSVVKAGTAFEAYRANSSGYFGVGTAAPTSRIDAEIIGGSKVITDILEVSNKYASLDMAGTGAGIFCNLAYYDAFVAYLAPAGRLAWIAEGNWAFNVNTRDSSLLLQTCLNGTVAEKWRINSNGHLVGNYNSAVTATSLLTAHAATDINLRVDESSSAIRLFGSTDNGGSFCPLTAEGSTLLLNPTQAGRIGMLASAPDTDVEIKKSVAVTERVRSTGAGYTANIQTSASSTGLAAFDFLEDTTLKWRVAKTADSAANLVVSSATTDVIGVLQSSGFVGVGTTAPDTKLEVRDTSAVTARVRSTSGGVASVQASATSAAAAALSLLEGTTTKWEWSKTANSTADLYLNSASGLVASFIQSTGYFGLGTSTPPAKLTVWNGDEDIVDTGVVDGEVLSNGALTSGTGWSVSGDFALASDKATWTFSSGSGLLVQQAPTLLLSPNRRWYKLVYTISGVTGTPSANLTTNIAEVTTPLTVVDGTQTTYFKGATSPTQFEISGTGTTGQSFSIDDLSLKEVTGGELRYSGIRKTQGMTTIERSVYLKEDAYFDLPTGVSGVLHIWNRSGHLIAHIKEDGSVMLIDSIAGIFVITNTDNRICVYDAGGGVTRVVNRLNTTPTTVGYTYSYCKLLEAAA